MKKALPEVPAGLNPFIFLIQSCTLFAATDVPNAQEVSTKAKNPNLIISVTFLFICSIFWVSFLLIV